MRGVLQLGVREEGGEHAEIGVAQCGGGEGQVEQVADDDVEEDAQIVGVEVFVGRGCGEEEVQQLEDEELEGGLGFPVEEEDEVFAEGGVSGAVGGESTDDEVGERGGGGREGRCVRGDHVLFVEDELEGEKGLG